LGLPSRQYVWFGGKWPKYETDDEGNIKTDVSGQPILHSKSEQDWCFAYGEGEWMSGENWNSIKKNAENFANGLPVVAGTLDPITACN
jgi:hypothetical protein